jgi:hypothetical protein
LRERLFLTVFAFFLVVIRESRSPRDIITPRFGMLSFKPAQTSFQEYLVLKPLNECNRDFSPIIGLINQLAASAAAADSLRRQIDNPGAPSANAPRVAGSGVWLLKAAVGSASSGPFVAPAMIGLLGMVS